MSRIPGGGNRHDRKRAARKPEVRMTLPIDSAKTRYRLDGYVVVVVPHDDTGMIRCLSHEYAKPIPDIPSGADAIGYAGPPAEDTAYMRATCTLETQRFYSLEGREFWVSPPCPHGVVAIADGAFSSDVREAMAFFGKGQPGVRVATEDPPAVEWRSPAEPPADEGMSWDRPDLAEYGHGGGTGSATLGIPAYMARPAELAAPCNVCGHRYDSHTGTPHWRGRSGCRARSTPDSVWAAPCPCSGFVERP